MKSFLKIYAVTFFLFLATDFVWLAYVSPSFYQAHIAHLLAPTPSLPAALAFYIIFVAGLVYFSVIPAAQKYVARRAFLHGAFFGLVSYATFDLTSQAVFRDWPTIVTVLDLLWGSTLCGVVTTLSARIYTRRFAR